MNTTTTGDQTNPAVIALKKLAFLIAYVSDDSNNKGIYVRKFTPNSSSNIVTNSWSGGSEILVNDQENDEQNFP